MSDGQFPPESPQDPVDIPASSDQTDFSPEPGLAPVSDEAVVQLPDGGQYPDDVFGITDAQSVPEVTIEPIAADAEPDLPPADTAGDMFSVNELMDEPAEPVAEPAEPLAAPEPLASPEPLAAPEPLHTADPLPTPAGSDMFSVDDLIEEHEEHEEPALAAPEPPSAIESFEAPTEPLAAPDAPPLASPEISNPYAPTEPIAPVAETEPVAPLEQAAEIAPEPVAEFAQSEPVNPYAEPAAAAEVVNPYAEPVQAEASAPQEVSNPYAEAPQAPEFAEAEPVNPYAEAPAEPAAMDASATPEYEAPPVEHYEEPVAEQYTEPVGQELPVPANEEVFDAYGTDQDVDPAAQPHMQRRESVAPPGMEALAVGGLVVADGGRVKGAPGAPAAEKKKRGSFSLGKKKQKDAPQPMPEEQIATAAEFAQPLVEPPTMPVQPEAIAVPEQLAPAVMQAPEQPVAPMMPAAAPVKTKKSMADRLFGEAKPGQRHSFFGIKFGKPGAVPGEQQFAPQAPAAAMPEQLAQAVQQPQPVQEFQPAPQLQPEQPVAPMMPAAAPVKTKKSMADRLFGEAKPGQRHSFFGIKFGKPGAVPGEQQFAPQAPAAPVVEVAPMPETAPVAEVAPQQPEQILAPPPPVAQAEVIQSAEAAAHAKKRGKKQKAPKAKKQMAPKQGKSMADRLFGEAKPGQRHSFFGIKFGKPGALPGQQQLSPEATPMPEIPQQQQYTAAASMAQPYQQVPQTAQTHFPGGYPADFARGAAEAQPYAAAAAPAQTPEQIMPPAEQVAQQAQAGQQ